MSPPLLALLLALGCTEPPPENPGGTLPSSGTASTDPGTTGWPGNTVEGTTATGSVTTPPGTTTTTGQVAGCGTPTMPLDTAGFGACDWAARVPGFLDPLQAVDGRTIFCHYTGGGTYEYLDVSYADCAVHQAHPCDLFPTWGC